MESTDGSNRPAPRANVVPSGCVMGTVIVILIVAVAGYFAYRHFADAFDVPEELAGYEESDAVRDSVKSRAAAPPEGTHLDARWVALYTGGAEATGEALLGARSGIDSIVQANRAAGDSGVGSILTSPSFYRLVTVIEPTAKRALVEYLNAQHRSLDEYAWAKRRVVAASDITRRSVDSALEAMIGRYIPSSPGMQFSLGDRESTDAFFDSIDSLRETGTITDAERALVMPHRALLLERGLASLFGFDSE